MVQGDFLLGFDIGSSSIKATLLDAANGRVVVSAISPKREMEIKALKPGWAEQDPELWWTHIQAATAEIGASGADLKSVKAIGISYQMHGLVVIDRKGTVLRPSIIWCDSRAVEIGAQAFSKLGAQKCLSCLLNSPGNFTASKLAWVKQNEPHIFERIEKIMLPGDFIAMCLTGSVTTTASGLSEGIMWDYTRQAPATMVLEHFGFSPSLLPALVPTFSIQGELTSQAAATLGLKQGTPVAYRAGDQPNNALSLNVLNPGEVAATAGTSGVVYGVGDRPGYDQRSRVNTFVHVNHSAETPRYGTLLCVNATGILNSWMKHNVSGGLDYAQMNETAATVPAGSDGLIVLPYGNGAERTLGNRTPGAAVLGLSLTTHNRAHLLRAAQEGIVFALNYGLQIMREMKIGVDKVRAGHANMFLSPLFAQTFATVSGAAVELHTTDGSQGAARGAGIGAGIYSGFPEAFESLQAIRVIEPDENLRGIYEETYHRWLDALNSVMK